MRLPSSANTSHHSTSVSISPDLHAPRANYPHNYHIDPSSARSSHRYMDPAPVSSYDFGATAEMNKQGLVDFYLQIPVDAPNWFRKLLKNQFTNHTEAEDQEDDSDAHIEELEYAPDLEESSKDPVVSTSQAEPSQDETQGYSVPEPRQQSKPMFTDFERSTQARWPQDETSSQSRYPFARNHTAGLQSPNDALVTPTASTQGPPPQGLIGQRIYLPGRPLQSQVFVPWLGRTPWDSRGLQVQSQIIPRPPSSSVLLQETSWSNQASPGGLSPGRQFQTSAQGARTNSPSDMATSPNYQQYGPPPVLPAPPRELPTATSSLTSSDYMPAVQVQPPQPPSILRSQAPPPPSILQSQPLRSQLQQPPPQPNTNHLQVPPTYADELTTSPEPMTPSVRPTPHIVLLPDLQPVVDQVQPGSEHPSQYSRRGNPSSTLGRRRAGRFRRGVRERDEDSGYDSESERSASPTGARSQAQRARRDERGSARDHRDGLPEYEDMFPPTQGRRPGFAAPHYAHDQYRLLYHPYQHQHPSQFVPFAPGHHHPQVQREAAQPWMDGVMRSQQAPPPVQAQAPAALPAADYDDSNPLGWILNRAPILAWPIFIAGVCIPCYKLLNITLRGLAD